MTLHTGESGMSSTAIAKADIATMAQLACILEVSAPKPGNVSPGRHFRDVRYEDFLAAALAIGEPLAHAGTRPLGMTIRLAVESSLRWTRSNTNLGIVLLLAPLARAAHIVGQGQLTPVRLREALRAVLDTTTVHDARETYVAIRRARPGGIGSSDEQDVAGEPTRTLVDVMRLAAHRDGVAREYSTSFEVTFEAGVPALERARLDGLSWDDAIVETFLTLLAANVDTHIVRRSGEALANDVMQRARVALTAGGVRSAEGRRAIEEMDAALRDERNSGNPGTAADLTAAAIFVVLLCGGWST